MSTEEDIVSTANNLKSMDDSALYVLLAKQEKAISENPDLQNDITLNPEYDGTHMGVISDLISIGNRILLRWNKELHDLICGGSDDKERKKLLDALNVGETAAIAAVVPLLLPILPAAAAAPAAVLIVRRFLFPAKDELCKAWGELIELEKL